MRRVGVLTAVCLLAVVLVAMAHAQEPASPLRPEHRVALAALVALVDQQIGSVGHTLETLAATQDARTGGWRAIKPLLARVEAGPVPCTCWYLRPDGRYYTVSLGLTEGSLSDRAYFPGLMAGRQVDCALVYSKSTGKKSAVVAAPILREGRVVGALGASLFLEELSARLDETLRLPENMLFFAVDAEGTGVLNVRPWLVFTDPREMGSPSLKEAVRQMLLQPEGTIHFEFEGASRDMYFQTSEVTGWRLALGVITRPG